MAIISFSKETLELFSNIMECLENHFKVEELEPILTNSRRFRINGYGVPKEDTQVNITFEVDTNPAEITLIEIHPDII